MFHTRACSAGLRACCIAGFLTCERPGRGDALPIGKSAIQQVGKPALRRFRPTGEKVCEICGLKKYGEVLNVTGLIIENRPGERRPDGLTLSTSDDAQQWTRVWTAPKWKLIWEVFVVTTQASTQRPGRPALYLKLETNPAKPVPMLRQRVEIYGI